MSEHLLPALMAFGTLAVIILGYPVALTMAGASAVFILIAGLPPAFFGLLVTRVFANALSNWLLVAVPMFIFMGLVLEKSGVAEKAMRSAQAALGGSASSMAVSILVIGGLLAASSGIVGASVILLTLIGLPRLIEAGYARGTAAGLVSASGTLAILIPPSLMLIILGDQMQTSIPDLFRGAVGPGLLLMGLYALYMVARAPRRPASAPPSTPATAGAYLGFLRDIAPMLALMALVLGAILGGFATPTEASGVGALGALLLAALNGRADSRTVMAAARETALATSMVMAIVIGATCFAAVFRRIGGDDMILAGLGLLGGDPWTMLAIMMLMIFLLGFFLDWLEITLILIPIFAPLVAGMDFGNGLRGEALLVWFAILVALNLQTSFLTPPFGPSLFYVRGSETVGLRTGELYAGVTPFILLQLAGLALVALFPALVFMLG
jgi:tripartite ATP-independent transporter DctM subunit